MTRRIPALRAAALACLLPLAGACLAADAAEGGVASLQAAYARSVRAGEQAEQYRELLATVLARVQRSYAREVDFAALSAAASRVFASNPPGEGQPAQVFKEAINAALRTLDPYSRYLDAQAQGSETESGGNFGGVGLEVEAAEDGVRVLAPIPSTPAARAGLRTGDVILRIDRQSLQGMGVADAIARMRGEPGTTVAVTIRRAGLEGEYTLSLTRETIRRAMLRWSMEGEVLVLRLATFNGPVAAALEKAIAEATANHAPRAVLLDLRSNPGGLLREAVKVADAFLKEGDIVSLRGRAGAPQRSWSADAAEVLPGLPMLVLVDGRSASAAELVAAALQDNGRARVMGQRSFGKGTVQSIYPLGAQSGALKLTTSFYHAPSGRSVQRVGITPDIELLGLGPVKALPDGAPPPQPALRVETARCAPPRAPDPAIACALAWLAAPDFQTFGRAHDAMPP